MKLINSRLFGGKVVITRVNLLRQDEKYMVRDHIKICIEEFKNIRGRSS